MQRFISCGLWLTDPIVLKSNIKIHDEAGALVIFSTNKDLYPLIKSSYEGQNSVLCLSPIYGKDLENIAFTGEVYLNLGLLLTIGSCQKDDQNLSDKGQSASSNRSVQSTNSSDKQDREMLSDTDLIIQNLT